MKSRSLIILLAVLAWGCEGGTALQEADPVPVEKVEVSAPETASETAPETAPVATPETAAPETVAEAVPETDPETVPEAGPEAAPEPEPEVPQEEETEVAVQVAAGGPEVAVEEEPAVTVEEEPAVTVEEEPDVEVEEEPAEEIEDEPVAPEEPDEPVAPAVDLSLGGGTVSLKPGEGNSGISADLGGYFSISRDGFDDVRFFFSEEMESITRIGDQEVSFKLADNGLKLYAWTGKGRSGEAVATIANGADSNILRYSRGPVADALLNTGGMCLYVKATAVLDSGDPIEVTFDGKDFFKAELIRPVEFASISADGFVDGVDFGEKGSYISIADLLSPVDWRDRSFEQYPNYWGYYGVQIGSDPNNYGFEVIVDTDGVECELAGKRQKVLAGMFIVQVDPSSARKSPDGKNFIVPDPVRPSLTVSIPANRFGYLMYFNNGRYLTLDFKLYVKAKVHYGFGYLNTGWIAVPVRRTAG